MPVGRQTSHKTVTAQNGQCWEEKAQAEGSGQDGGHRQRTQGGKGGHRQAEGSELGWGTQAEGSRQKGGTQADRS